MRPISRRHGRTRLRRLRRWVSVAAAVLTFVVTALAGSSLSVPAHAHGRTSYTNPVSASFTRQFADPTVIRGRDGYWYAYATNGTRFPGDDRQLLMIARSPDLVHWSWVGEVFTPETEPTYDGQTGNVNRQFWAPDVDYIDGRYVMYYSYVVNTPGKPKFSVIGVATAPTPAGPWKDTGSPAVGRQTWNPRPGVTAYRNVIDPDEIAAADGTRYLYYGSVLGGVRVVQLSPDGLHAVGDPIQLTPENRFEASFVVHRGRYYYLFTSEIGGCCAGPASAYPVVVARSTSPTGPFVDRDGNPMSGRHAGGTPVVAPNGNRFVSTGHNSVVTDPSGQDWIVTHALDRFSPYVNGATGANARQLAITRLDWIDGWPVARGGRGIPDTPTPAPDMATVLSDQFEHSGGSATWRAAAGWTTGHAADGGYAHAASGAAPLVSSKAVHGDIRLRADLRLAPGSDGRAGLTMMQRGTGGITAWIDRSAGQLVLQARAGRRNLRATADLPASYDYSSWHEVEMVRRGDRVTAQVSDAGRYDPVAVATVRTLAGLAAGLVAVQVDGTAADVDDVTAARLFTPVTQRVPAPRVGRIDRAASDEFTTGLGAGWRWHGTPAATVSNGALDFPLQSSDLVAARSDGSTPSLLLRSMPAGTWTAEIELTVPYGESLPYGWPQAGMVAFQSNDSWVTLSSATRVSPRYVSFGEQVPWNGGVRYGYAALGPQADTMWLRLQHTVDPRTGEHHYRAAISIDGTHWTWQGTRVLPAGPQPQLGLFAMGQTEHEGSPQLVARFEYFHVLR